MFPNYGLEQNFDTKKMLYNKLYIYYATNDWIHPFVLNRFNNCEYIKCNNGHFGTLKRWYNSFN